MALILQILLLVIGVGGAMVSAFALSNPLWRNVCVAAFSLLGFVGLGLTVITFQSSPTAQDIAAEVAKTIPGSSTSPPRLREEVSVSPEEITDLFRDRTSIQAAALVNGYVGKWIRLSGPVDNVFGSREERRTSVSFLNRGLGKPSQVEASPYFESQWFDRVSALQRGDQIVTLCEISRVRRLEIELKNCELVDVKPAIR